jgi:hypothetical protein
VASLVCDKLPLVSDVWSFDAGLEHAPKPRPIATKVMNVQVFMQWLFMVAPLNLCFLRFYFAQLFAVVE